MSWTSDTVLEFLELYRREQHLWDPKHPLHRNRSEVSDSWIRIQASLSIQCSITDLKKKKESLMTSFRMHLGKKKVQPGYRTTWFAYSLMESFLGGKYECDSTNQLENETDDLHDRNMIMTSTKRINNFIAIVKSNPVLYDTTQSEHKNTFLKNKIWDEIGERINLSGDDAKAKWKNLRDTYSKYLKASAGQSTSQKYSRFSKWQWASDMEFMKDYVCSTSTDSSMTLETDIGNDSQNIKSESENNNENLTLQTLAAPSSPSSLLIPRLRKRPSEEKVITYLNSKIVNHLSSTELLMLGYAKTIEGFSNRRKINTQMKIAQIIMEAELEEEEERSQAGNSAKERNTENRSENDRSNNSQSDSGLLGQENAEYLLLQNDQYEHLVIKGEIDEEYN